MGNTFRPDNYATDVESIKEDFMKHFSEEVRLMFLEKLLY